jgi:hypothetical protein
MHFNSVFLVNTNSNTMKKHLKTICLGLLSITFSLTANSQGYIVHDLTTGIVNGTTTPIAYDSPDDTWRVALPFRPGFFQAAKACSNLNGAWAVNSCGRWITQKLDGIDPTVNGYVGTYQYQTTFSMSEMCIPWATATFSYIGGDNNITAFKLNGHIYPLSPSTANDFNPLAQNVSVPLNPNHFLLGASNTITIDVNNTETYSGFYACGNVTVGYCTLMSPNNNSTSPHGENKFLNTKETFNIFPNPSTGKFSLVLGQSVEGNVGVIDLMGRKVWSSKLSTDKTNYEIDLTSLPKGIYNLSVQTGKNVQSRKVVIE